MRQYRIDAEAFVDSLSKLTGISKRFLRAYNKTNTFGSLFTGESPPELTDTQKHKLRLFIQFKALYEIENPRNTGFTLNTSTKAGNFFANYYSREYKNYISVAYTNTQNVLIGVKNTRFRAYKDLLINKRELIKDILDNNAKSVMFGYYNNSPECILTATDAKSVEELRRDLKLVGVNFNDSIIINSDNTYYSIAENSWDAQWLPNKSKLNDTIYSKTDLAIANYNNAQSLSTTISGLTGIEEAWLNQYFEKNPVKCLLENNQRFLPKKQKASLELLKRVKNLLPNIEGNEYSKDYIMNSPISIVEYFKNQFSNINDKEYFVLALLDEKNRIIKTEVAFTGTIDESPVYPREIVKAALEVNAASVIFAHNHPGGLLKPSSADITLTRKLIDALQVINIDVLDHIVVARDSAISISTNYPNVFDKVIAKRNTKKAILEGNADFQANERTSVYNKIKSAEKSSANEKKNPQESFKKYNTKVKTVR